MKQAGMQGVALVISARRARQRRTLPKPSPGVKNICVSPAFLPATKNVELISTSGQNLRNMRYWKAVLESSCLPSVVVSPLGRFAPSVDCTSNFPHALPKAIAGERTASRIAFEPPGTVALRSSVTR